MLKNPEVTQQFSLPIDNSAEKEVQLATVWSETVSLEH